MIRWNWADSYTKWTHLLKKCRKRERKRKEESTQSKTKSVYCFTKHLRHTNTGNITTNVSTKQIELPPVVDFVDGSFHWNLYNIFACGCSCVSMTMGLMISIATRVDWKSFSYRSWFKTNWVQQKVYTSNYFTYEQWFLSLLLPGTFDADRQIKFVLRSAYLIKQSTI